MNGMTFRGERMEELESQSCMADMAGLDSAKFQISGQVRTLCY